MSIDGRIAMKNGESKWITSKQARQDVQQFRAKSSAILTSSSTILKDNSLFSVRYEEFNKETSSIFPKKIFKHPIRVIIDSKNRIKPSHKIIQTKETIWLFRLKLDTCIWPENTSQIIVKEKNKKINILSALKLLGKLEINNLWIEAGSTLSGFLLNSNLVDELIIYIAPKILGHEAKPLCIIHNQFNLLDVLKFNFKNVCQIGSDIRIILSPKTTKINI
ncbi:bifunctional diaminohydroxyphosphoribosylaminopyrimidine deaminase/5-amino-6-(5-phosphoribosylamino)uracil reductase RibD [Buchnera aphidicola (Artemisaphis artemisicola)]|uniref:5-amino-6-(5-phosphoribosylamino)uracil reductase n=1 Tax=Buchnera aphidicola (Artemisaphis artemisicola) TaxID=1241836 RepID=A0A4D6XMB0_9GAMM|nr:bifunctional diaminohydroxyphosphoribosylaminopyrimidine deaminase/5-amino-6-(5-phosphoribosylamino)uracil reductase RibD [Buchnera aphidicola (Artemisaphis artemisicola)]